MNAMLRILVWTLALALVVLPVVAVVNGWIGAERWPLTKLRVHGQFKQVEPAFLRTEVLPYAQRGFFAVQLQDAQARLEAMPWVEKAEVRKRWPDTLEITIVEHRPFARWGQDRLLSDAGKIFATPRDLETSAFPQLDGPDSQAKDVVALYNDAVQLFNGTGVRVQTLVMDARGSWSLQLSNGTQVVVGRADPRPRLRRFARLLPRLNSDPNQRLERADLRYTNGFSLVWEKVNHQDTKTAIPADAGRGPAQATT